MKTSSIQSISSKPCRPSFPTPGLPASPHHSRNLALLRRASAEHRCLDAVQCDQCLEEVARALACGLEYSLDRARAMMPEAYQAELGAELCDLERAREMKWMAMRACYTATHPDPVWVATGGGLTLAASAAAPALPAGRWEGMRRWMGEYPLEFGVVCGLAMGFGLGLLFGFGGTR